MAYKWFPLWHMDSIAITTVFTLDTLFLKLEGKCRNWFNSVLFRLLANVVEVLTLLPANAMLVG